MHGALIRLKHGLKDESGQAVVFVALGMVAILSFVGLAIDVGQLRYAQSQLQSAADAAALAGALEISYCGGITNCSAMQTAAQKSMSENGLTGSTLLTQCSKTSESGLTLMLNNGPCAMGSTANDPQYGNPNYVEAVLTEPQPTIFARVLGIKSMKIAARAEAAMGNSPFCLDVTGTSGTTFQENGAILTASCGILVSSSGTPAFQANGGTINTTAIDVHGTAQVGGVSMTPATPTTGVPAMPDPLSSLPPPTVGSCGSTKSSPYTGAPSSTVATVSSGTMTLNPGVYCDGIQVNGGTAVFNPGMYIVEGLGLQVNGGTLAGGNGVTFYLPSGSVQFNGTSATVDLVAPTTGTYAGILFFQSATDASVAEINGGAGSIFQGALYFPDAEVQLNGSNVAAYTIVDSKSVQLNGGSFSLGNNYSSLPGGSPTKSVTSVLAE